MDLEEINKPSWKPKYQSEYSMGELDFQRYDTTLKNVDELSGLVNSTYVPDLELMQKFFAQLINLYDNFKPLISNGKVQEEIDNMRKEGQQIKRLWEKSKASGVPMNPATIFKFVDVCNALKTKLYYVKQVIGLGIVVKKNLTPAERIKMGIHGDKSFENLPES